jgi:flagellar biogenesis protein FliO
MEGFLSLVFVIFLVLTIIWIIGKDVVNRLKH